MKTYQIRPVIDAHEYVDRLEHRSYGYPAYQLDEVVKLSKAWLREIAEGRAECGMEPLNKDIKVAFLANFLFEVGRQYGIQQERQRRSARA